MTLWLLIGAAIAVVGIFAGDALLLLRIDLPPLRGWLWRIGLALLAALLLAGVYVADQSADAERVAAAQELARNTADIARWRTEIAGHEASLIELNAVLARHKTVLDRDIQGHPVLEADLVQAREIAETVPLDIVRAQAAIAAANTRIAAAERRNAELALVLGQAAGSAAIQ